ncbi:MAG TPA: ShlB/FhaC/HecB family hemolysin secretion/activation protein [Steroidobacteraceae bacterium]
MTITSGGTVFLQQRALLAGALVIILPASFAHAQAPAPPVVLTTSKAPAPAAPTLATVVVDGSTAYDAARLFVAYREQLGQPISREGARAIVDALLALYDRDGYVRPEIRLDDSMTGRGVLRVRVSEAQVSNVVFEGDAGRYQAQLEEIGVRLQGARPLRKDDVPDALRAMRRMAGLTITASTRKDPELTNAFELVVKSDFSPVDGVVRMNNRGTEQVGPAFVLAQLFANGLLGRQDKFGLIAAAASDPEEYLGGGLYADVGLGDAGTHGSALLFRSHSAPNERPIDHDDEYRRDRLTLRITHPLSQDSTSSLSIGAAFDADDLVIERSGFALREERLRIFETGLRGTWRSAGATQYSANLSWRKGVDAFGAGLQAHDLADDPRRADFLLTQLSGTVYRRFAVDWSVRFDAFAQHSGYVLPDGERFKIGGDRLGRGFEVAEIAGDKGIGGKLELRRDLVSTQGLLGRVSAYGFYDFGAAWKQDRPGRESAATAGTGFALQGSTVTGYLEVAAPLTGADIEGKRRASVFAELSYRF